ncbi:MAG: HAD-IA family hydrolase [Patescibacteria group bacterium]
MIKAIIFDITGVLFPHQPWIGVRPTHEELMKIKRLATDVYDQKKMSKKYLKKKLFETNRPHEELEAIYNSLTIIDQDLFDLIKKLSKKYDIYAMANEVQKWTDIRKDITRFDKYFTKLFISIEVGLRKPNEDFYTFFLSETGLEPHDCLFVDDKKSNVEVAEKLGFHGFTYKDYKNFREFIDKKALLENLRSTRSMKNCVKKSKLNP